MSCVFAVLNCDITSTHFFCGGVWGDTFYFFFLFPWCVQVHDLAVHLHTPRKHQRQENTNFRPIRVAMQIKQGEETNINTRRQKFAFL